jgi:flagellar protein FliO/FliZ
MSPLLAQFAAAGQSAGSGTPSLLGPDRIAGMAGALLVVLAVVLALAWVVQRLGAVRTGLGRSIRIREVLSVGTRERLLLLDCEGQRLLIGTSPAGLFRLHAFDGVVEEDAEPLPATPGVSTSSFAGFLARRLRPQADAKPVQAGEDDR